VLFRSQGDRLALDDGMGARGLVNGWLCGCIWTNVNN
jgi:hypothetical protein